MGDWSFLGGILEEVHMHSTTIGKVWLTILFIFRMLVLGVAAEDVWNDEQSEFICNTQQPGCRNMCYDHAFPISLIRYWVLQVIFVSSPSLAYMGHALYRLRTLEKERQKRKAQMKAVLEAAEFEMTEDRKKLEREIRQLEQRKLNKAPLRGSLLYTYVIHIFIRSALETGFMIGQYILYGFQLDPLYKCRSAPCPNAVDCFVSRPTEKTVFLVFMQSIAVVSLCLNLLELLHLVFKRARKGIYRRRDEVGQAYAGDALRNGLEMLRRAGTAGAPPRLSPPTPSWLLENQTGPAPLCHAEGRHERGGPGSPSRGLRPHNSSSSNNNEVALQGAEAAASDAPLAGLKGGGPSSPSTRLTEQRRPRHDSAGGRSAAPDLCV
ncbi:gap junction alpha-9 protein [Sphaerodactylus townsendi]|uniref:gap junction alpha-9 protein n=1 Tax=Sphaerodactylus townsendi TaxID=933632 RepID=UPI0020260108|nr:gap junction alpha-9 protein [Sphaerodactylus townsendi]XP_048357922.1 gap junction alpha-9 protein [Sphaerodactylus townsendi]